MADSEKGKKINGTQPGGKGKKGNKTRDEISSDEHSNRSDKTNKNLDDKKADKGLERKEEGNKKTSSKDSKDGLKQAAASKSVKQTPSKSTGKKKKKKGKSKKTEKRFDILSAMFTFVCIVALLAVTALGTYLLAPEFYRRIVYSTPLDRGGPVIRFGERDVSAEEYRYRMLYYNAAIEGQYGVDYVLMNPSVEKQLKQSLENDLKSRYAKLLWAEELGVTLSAQEKAEVDLGIAAYIEKLGGLEEFDKSLDKGFLSRDLYFRLQYEDRIITKLDTVLKDRGIIAVTDDDVNEYLEEKEILFAKSILISTQSVESEAEVAQKKALAERILRRIRAGEDFDVLMYEYTDDPGINNYPDGYSFSPGQFVPEYEAAVKELEIDEVADLVTSSAYGFFIIKRIAPDMKAYHENLFRERFTEMLDDRIEAMEENGQIHFYWGYRYIAIADNLWQTAYPADN